jgi:hypothetical protein
LSTEWTKIIDLGKKKEKRKKDGRITCTLRKDEEGKYLK